MTYMTGWKDRTDFWASALSRLLVGWGVPGPNVETQLGLILQYIKRHRHRPAQGTVVGL